MWDALGKSVLPDGGAGVVLVEGKSYPQEMYSGSSRAGKMGSAAAIANRKRIRDSIALTQTELGIPSDPERWISPRAAGTSTSVYQTGNRLAHTMWLRRNGVNAVFCHALFVEDPTYRSATRAEWEAELPKAESQLGIASLELPWLGHAFFPGLDDPA